MKRNFVRFLTVMVVGIMLKGCGKKVYKVTIPSETPHDNITYEVNIIHKNYYNPTDEERQYAYLVAYAMTHGEAPIIQTMGTNVAINIAKENGVNLIDVFNSPNYFSGMHDGVWSISITNEDGKLEWIPVTEDMLTDELKEAVDLAFAQNFTDGSLFYYKRQPDSKMPMPEEFIQEGDWIFFKEFSK